MKVMTMGLDMYACKTRDTLTAPVDFEASHAITIHYWRKHPNLHGWMEQLYREKDGKAASFNVVNLQLTGDDLDQLEQAITGKNLPFTEGFFFGESDGSEIADDLTFIAKAREALTEGYSIFYSSWW